MHPLHSKGEARLERSCPGSPRPQDEGGKKWPLTRSCLAPRSQPTQILFLPAGQMLCIRLRPLQSLSGCAGGLCSSWIPAPGRWCPPLVQLTHSELGWAQVRLWLGKQSCHQAHMRPLPYSRHRGGLRDTQLIGVGVQTRATRPCEEGSPVAVEASL